MTDDYVSRVYSHAVSSSSSEIDSISSSSSSLSTHPTSAPFGNDTNGTTPSPPFDASCYGLDVSDSAIMASHEVYLGVSLVFVVVGLIGNVLSVLVFTSRDMRAVSSNVYLFVLALSDSLYLISVFVGRLLPIARCWFFPWAPVDIINRSEVMCDAMQYLNDLFSDYSTCLIMAFTIERGLAVFSPITFRDRCTVARARIVCAVMFVVIAAVILPYHVIMMTFYPDYHVCTIDREFNEMFSAFYLVEVLALRVAPVTTIAILNAFIIARITRLTREKNRRRRHSAAVSAGSKPSNCAKNSATGATNGDNQHLMVPVCTDGDESSVHELDVSDKHSNSLSLPRLNVNGGTGNHNGDHAKRHFFRRPTSTPASPTAATSASGPAKRRGSLDDRNLQLTIILILVSSSYFVAYLPVMIHFFLTMMDTAEWIKVGNSELTIFGNYSKTLYIGGFAINFFLYTMSGRVFRDQLRTILCPSHHSAAAAGLQCCSCGKGVAKAAVERKNRPAQSEYVRPGYSTAPPEGTIVITEFVNEPAATTAF